MTIRKYLALAATVASFIAAPALANNFSYSGAFKNDNSKAVVIFTVVTPGTVTFSSTGYAAGGFDPIVSLYNPNGDFIDDNDDNGASRDPFLSANLAAGKYRLYLTQYNNFGPASVRSDTFAFDGQPNFRGGFIDSLNNQRTANYALDVTGVDAAKILASVGAVPEPSTWAMMIGGLGIVGAAARRRARKTFAVAQA